MLAPPMLGSVPNMSGGTMRKPARSLRAVVTIGLIALVVSVIALRAPAANPSDATWKTATLKAAGLSLRYPSTWTRRKIAKKSPELQREVFYAADLNAALADEVKSTISVQVVPTGGFASSLDQFTSDITPALKKMGATAVDASRVRVGGKRSYRADALLPFELPDGSSLSIRVSGLAVPHRGGGIIITVTTSADDAGTQLIDDVLGSVRRI
jgi:hypothetical protein